MNLQPFYELRERLHVTVNAGVNLITEDFRLKRAAEAIAPFAKAAPVFQKIDQMVKKLISPVCPDRSMVLLDTLALLDAVLITQGQTGAAGTIESLGDHEEDADFFQYYTNINSRTLRPLVDAMTGTGGGRYNVIQETYNASPKLFDDFRIRRLLVNCLGDSYAEIGNMAAQWLKEKGSDIVPILKKDFDPKGKKEMVHRVEIIAEIAGAKENEFYLEQIPKSQKEVKEVLIESLRFEQGNADILLDLMKSEKGKAKASAQWASGFMNSEKIQEYWLKASTAPKSLEDSPEEWTGDLLAKRLMAFVEQLAESFASKSETANDTIKESDSNLLSSYLQAIRGKKINIFPELLETFAKNADKIDGLKLEKSKNNLGNIEKVKFKEQIAHALADSIVITATNINSNTNNNEWLSEMASEITKFCDTYRNSKINSANSVFLETAFITALFTKPAEQVYEEFSGYLQNLYNADCEEMKKKIAKRDSKCLFQVFSLLQYDRTKKKYMYRCDRNASWKGEYRAPVYAELPYGLDTRWYDLIFEYPWKKEIKCQQYIGYHHYIGFDVILRSLFRCDTEKLKKQYGTYYYQKSCTETMHWEIAELFMECGYGSPKGILKAQILRGSNLYPHMIRRFASELKLSNQEVLAELKEAKAALNDDKHGISIRVDGWIKRLEEGAEVSELT